MALPFSTTLIDILRAPLPVSDGWEQPDISAWEVVAEGVPAVISVPRGSSVQNGAIQEQAGFHLSAEPCDLEHTDAVRDLDGSLYRVAWLQPRVGFGLDHVEAGLNRVTGILP